jgi:hypothetical protein
MKKLLLIIMLLMFSSLAMAATVTRDMPTRILPNQELTVTLRLTNIDSEGVAMAVEDTIPNTLSIKEWNIQGTTQFEDEIDYRFENNRAAWAFIPSSTSATITYKIQLPNQETTYNFGPLVWFDKAGMSPQGAGTASLLVTTQPEPTTTTTTMQPVTTTTMQESIPEEIIEEEIVVEKRNNVWLFVVLILIVVAIVAYFIFKKKD